jgi:imidazolonepropionase-like amidohydrolase
MEALMTRQRTASVSLALAAAVTAVAQTPSARDDAMPLLRDAPRIALLTFAFARAGGRVVLGSDPNNLGEGRIAGLADHDIIKNVVTFGFSPLETIRMATLDGAAFLRIQDRTGSIAVGKEADLQIIRGAPDRDISDIDNVEIVFANGIAYDPKLLLSRLKGLVGSR